MTRTKWRISTPETALIVLTGSHVFIMLAYVDHTLQNGFFFSFQAMTNLAVDVDFMFH